MESPAPKSAAPSMTDSEVRTALWSAGIPGTYHAKDRSLQNVQIPVCQSPVAAQAREWVTNAKLSALDGECAAIEFDGRNGLDLAFLSARSMVLQGVAIMAMSLPSLCELTVNRYHMRNADKLEDMHGRDYLMILGALGSGDPPYPPEKMFDIEWTMRSWILAGKPLVLQGSSKASLCQWWTPGFIDLFLSKCPHHFITAEAVSSTRKPAGPSPFKTR